MSDQLDQFLNEQLGKNKEVDRALARLNSFETRGTFYGFCGNFDLGACASGVAYRARMTQVWDYSPGDWPGGLHNTYLILTGTTQVTAGLTTVSGVGSLYLTEIWKGAAICDAGGNAIGVIDTVISNTAATLLLPSLLTYGPNTVVRYDAFISVPTTGIWLMGANLVSVAVATIGYVFCLFNFPGVTGTWTWYTRGATQSASPVFLWIQYLTKGNIIEPWFEQSNAGASAETLTGQLWAVKLS